jgi:hypothetical protein
MAPQIYVRLYTIPIKLRAASFMPIHWTGGG